MTAADLLTIGSGSIVGLILGLVGGGGSILAVPLLVYVVGIPSVHAAIGTSAIAVAGSAAVNLVPHWRAGNVKWRCALVFAAAGVAGALAGSSIAKAVEGTQLLLLFGLLMVVVGLTMAFNRHGQGDADVQLTGETAMRLLPRLAGIGFGVGALAGFFGIGGGFLIVPGLMLATGMPIRHAIGTSLVAVTAFGAATAANYAVSGYVDWRIAGLFVLGGLAGGIAGVGIGKLMSRSKNALRYAFAATVVGVGGWIVWHGLTATG
ncbi:MAG TPA: sulfite exporter TauE/SafE family protein [Devosiaceae bacterium]|nr:sulfite exporter TauE/SafE family protein [Devosiaceae bacterium]